MASESKESNNRVFSVPNLAGSIRLAVNDGGQGNNLTHDNFIQLQNKYECHWFTVHIANFKQS